MFAPGSVSQNLWFSASLLLFSCICQKYSLYIMAACLSLYCTQYFDHIPFYVSNSIVQFVINILLGGWLNLMTLVMNISGFFFQIKLKGNSIKKCATKISIKSIFSLSNWIHFNVNIGEVNEIHSWLYFRFSWFVLTYFYSNRNLIETWNEFNMSLPIKYCLATTLNSIKCSPISQQQRKNLILFCIFDHIRLSPT